MESKDGFTTIKLVLKILILVFIGCALYFLLQSKATTGNITPVAIGSGIFPDIVSGIPVLKDGDTVRVESYSDDCHETPVKFCGRSETRRYIPPDVSTSLASWSFRVSTTRITQGKNELKESVQSTAKVIHIADQDVFFKSNGVTWFPDGTNADMVKVILMPTRNGLVTFNKITESDVKKNANFIATFLMSFPPASD